MQEFFLLVCDNVCFDLLTAVDIWAAGVILLSMLSSRYPFFKAPCDLTALAQIVEVFGTDAITKAAEAIGEKQNLLSFCIASFNIVSS